MVLFVNTVGTELKQISVREINPNIYPESDKTCTSRHFLCSFLSVQQKAQCLWAMQSHNSSTKCFEIKFECY